MNKVLIYIKDGIVHSAHANGEIEICILEEDSNAPNTFTTPLLNVYETATFDQEVKDSWKKSVESELKHQKEVEVCEDKDLHPFIGTVEGGVKSNADGSYYVTVLDGDNKAHDVGIFNISFNI